MTEEFDAIVVGSGVSGGWVTKELCEKGLKVLLVERGRQVEHGVDYPGEGRAPWEFDLRGRLKEEEVEENHEIQKKCYAFYDGTSQFFVNDKENPYEQAKDAPFDWIRGYHSGGKSLLWHRQSYRWAAKDFESNKKDGYGCDWPIRYDDLAPWYDYVEEFAGISGNKDGLDNLPDGVFQKPHEFTVLEKFAKEKIEENFPGRNLIMGRCAHLTEPTEEQMALGRGLCQSRNECQRGCSWGGYFSSLSATLPAAKRTNNLTMVHDKIVHSVIYDETTKKASGVRVIDSNTKAGGTYKAKMVFLCASTIPTTQILLNSKSETFKNGIANSSGVVGRYLMDHIFHFGADASHSGFTDRYYKGRRPTGIYIPRYVNYGDDDRDFLRGYGFQGGSSRTTWWRGNWQEGVGADLKTSLKQPGKWRMHLGGYGEMLPYEDNTITLTNKTDKWGIPILKIDCTLRENEKKIMKAAADDAVDMLTQAGFENVQGRYNLAAPGLSIHEMGTARMGRDPKTSALNGWNQAHDIDNLFVTDGASMASSACQNPSLTYMALSARAANYAVGLLKEGKL
ncbi:GMC family oxidoreductase [Temperatibacter marinus]|uniref:GMC family oxidoreductase n=1 Tax=Temperatibacter marinus TaxID=1456591 RepID=A0AA52H917_9PROT|nr:GMC family oxidoreductase [Temperatibacter marinus]WND02706.1 GMC family oxidoreductase [Temperatibacter marinus]